jgi:hypothetical protein
MSLVPTLLLGGVLLAAYWLVQRNRNIAREAFIERYVFPQRLRSKLAERYPHLSPAHTEQALQGLREYFQLCRMAKRRMVSMPSQAVDVLWHELILHTRQYQQFCDKAIGRFLHHVPSEAMRSPTQAQEGIRRAWRLACAREGIAPRSPTRLPLLFALDAELGIADGFRYRLNCRDDQGGVAAGYCASDIGCSSGCAGSSGADSSGDSSGCGGGCGGGGD